MSVGSRTRNVAKFGQARAARAPISLSGALRHRAAPERGAHGRSSACDQPSAIMRSDRGKDARTVAEPVGAAMSQDAPDLITDE